MPQTNPYAPPRAHDDSVAYAPAHEPTLLPEGIRRYTLDLEATYCAVGRGARLVVFGYILVFVAPVALLTARDRSSFALPFVAPLMLLFVMQIRRRSIAARTVARYELVESARVLRRSSHQGVAEIAASEVKEARETRRGLYLFANGSRDCFVLPRFLGGYDELRAQISTWLPIAPMGAWQAIRRTYFASRRRTIPETILAADPSLREELLLVRAACVLIPNTKSVSRPWRTVILWAVLVFMVLAIWQFLTPAPANPNAVGPRAAPTSS